MVILFPFTFSLIVLTYPLNMQLLCWFEQHKHARGGQRNLISSLISVEDEAFIRSQRQSVSRKKQKKERENLFNLSEVDFLSTRMRLISSPLQSVSKATDEISWNFTQLNCDISANVGHSRVLASLSVSVFLSHHISTQKQHDLSAIIHIFIGSI